MFDPNLEKKLNRALSLKKVLASLDFDNNKLYICLDFTNSNQEEKRKDYYLSVVKNLISIEIIDNLQELIITGKKHRSILWKEKYNRDNLRQDKISDNQNNQEENSLINDILAEGFAFQKRRTIKPAGKVAKQLAEELLELLDNDKNKAEAILKSLINFHGDNSIEWYLEKAISQVLKEKDKSIL